MSLKDLLREIRQGEDSLNEKKLKKIKDQKAKEIQEEIFGDSGSGKTTAESSRSSSPEPEELYNGMSKDELELFAKKIGEKFFFLLLKADLNKTANEQSSFLSDEEKANLEDERYQKLAELAALEDEMAQIYEVLKEKNEEEHKTKMAELEKLKAEFNAGVEVAKEKLEKEFAEVKEKYLEIFGTKDTISDLDTIEKDQGDLIATIEFMEDQNARYNDNLEKINEIKTVLKNLPEELKEKYKDDELYKDFNSRCGNIDDKSCNVAIVDFFTDYSNLKTRAIVDMRALKDKIYIDAKLKEINDQRKERAEMRERNKTRKRPPMGIKKPHVNTRTEREPLLSNFSKQALRLIGSKPKQPAKGGKTVKRRNRKTKRQQKRRKNKSNAKNKCKK